MASRFRRNLWRATLVVLCLLLALVVWFVALGARSGILVTIGKDTTYIAEPLRPDGYPDYFAALKQQTSDGVTPANNSAVLFIRAMGPSEIWPQIRERYFEMLGIGQLPPNGEYFVTYDATLNREKAAVGTVADAAWETRFLSDFNATLTRPWSKKEFPVWAAWLSANEKPLALLTEATKRPRRYEPLLPDGKDSLLIAGSLATVLQSREAARALTSRAMFRLHSGDLDGAWQDILACHRLARLEAQGPTLIELDFAFTVDGIAAAGHEAVLNQPNLSAVRIARMRADLAALPPLPAAVEKIDIGERFTYLDVVCSLARNGLAGKKPKGVLKLLVNFAGRAMVDWNIALQMGNSWYDRQVEAARKPTRAERKRAQARINRDIAEMSKKVKDPSSLVWSFLAGPRRAASQTAGQLGVVLFLPAESAILEAEDRWTMQCQISETAFALAAYRTDYGTYPAKLADLKPKYVKKIPTDMFNGEADLHYTRKGDGYRLYSVGPNGIDNGGRGYADREKSTDPSCNDWDDIGVRVGGEGK
jgi:hypothetical protein